MWATHEWGGYCSVAGVQGSRKEGADEFICAIMERLGKEYAVACGASHIVVLGLQEAPDPKQEASDTLRSLRHLQPTPAAWHQTAMPQQVPAIWPKVTLPREAQRGFSVYHGWLYLWLGSGCLLLKIGCCTRLGTKSHFYSSQHNRKPNRR